MGWLCNRYTYATNTLEQTAIAHPGSLKEFPDAMMKWEKDA